MLLLEQASNLISYQRRQNLLPNLIKDSRKAKAALLQKHHQNLFGKKFTARIIESEKLKKRKQWRSLKAQVFSLVTRSPFHRDPRQYLYQKA